MFRENQNPKSHLKDSSSLPVSYISGDFYAKFYNKTNKLITALYMVTDIMDKEEPLRSKLRILGTGIISDIYSNSVQTDKKIAEILSFLEVASTVGMVSEMNHAILKKEFSELGHSLTESRHNLVFLGRDTTLEDFLKEDKIPNERTAENTGARSIPQTKQARIGVQKGSTLMKALSDRIPGLSDTKGTKDTSAKNFDVLRKDRRDEIIKIIKAKSNMSNTDQSNFPGLTITDIKSLATGVLLSCGEKTLQRELVSLVKDGVLKKSGDKRWSRYFLAPTQGF